MWRGCGRSRPRSSRPSELADTPVREGRIVFREAHEIMARVVDRTVAEGKTADRIELAIIDEAAGAQLGHGIPISIDNRRAALDPAPNVTRRTGFGGPVGPAIRVALTRSRSECRRPCPAPGPARAPGGRAQRNGVCDHDDHGRLIVLPLAGGSARSKPVRSAMMSASRMMVARSRRASRAHGCSQLSGTLP